MERTVGEIQTRYDQLARIHPAGGDRGVLPETRIGATEWPHHADKAGCVQGKFYQSFRPLATQDRDAESAVSDPDIATQVEDQRAHGPLAAGGMLKR